MSFSVMRQRVLELVRIASAASLVWVWLLTAPSHAISPTAVTTAATNRTGTSATLNGITNPGGAQTTAVFRYSTTQTPCGSGFTQLPASESPVPAGVVDVNVSMPLTGLTQGTTYYFCLLTSNAFGSALGNQLSSTTLNTPAVTTSAVTALSATTVTLNGAVNPRGLSITAWFRYSTVNPGTCNDSFGTRTPAGNDSALGSGMAAQNYSQNITGLIVATTYYVCAIAQNSDGPGFGNVLTVPTPYAVLDVDQNRVVDTQTDSLLITRYLLGLRGDALVAGALGANAQRTNAQAIEIYIRSLLQ